MGRLLACIRIRMVIGSMSLGFPLVASPEEPSSDKTDVLVVKDVVISCTRLPGEAVDARTLPAKVHHYHGRRYKTIRGENGARDHSMGYRDRHVEPDREWFPADDRSSGIQWTARTATVLRHRGKDDVPLA